MAISDTVTMALSTTNGSVTTFSGFETETGNSVSMVQTLPFAANSNSASFTLTFNANSVQSIFMVATQNCTINTNNSTSPTNTVTLIAGIPLYWGRSAGYFPQPMNANTNGAFLSCNAATILNLRVLTN